MMNAVLAQAGGGRHCPPCAHSQRVMTNEKQHALDTLRNAEGTITAAPSLHRHHCSTITAPSPHHHCTITAPSLHHHCTEDGVEQATCDVERLRKEIQAHLEKLK
jgi:hypothetical protein